MMGVRVDLEGMAGEDRKGPPSASSSFSLPSECILLETDGEVMENETFRPSRCGGGGREGDFNAPSLSFECGVERCAAASFSGSALSPSRSR